MTALPGSVLRAAAVAALSLLAACTDSAVAPQPHATGALAGGSTAPAPRFLVVAKHGESVDDVSAAIRAAGGTVQRVHRPTGVIAARGLTASGVAGLRARADIRGVARDVRINMIPRLQLFRAGREMTRVGARSAPHMAADQSGAAGFELQWYLRQLRAPEAWAASNQGDGALVCILDTGIDPGHPELAGLVDLDASTSFVEEEPFIEDLNTHGTAVASLVATNGIVMASVAPRAKLCAVKIVGGGGEGSTLELIFGILHAADVGADVINMSFGAVVPRNDPDIVDLIEFFNDLVIPYALDRGVFPVAAAGNESINLARRTDLFVIPAMLRGVVSVGATGPVQLEDFYRVASYSNTGKRGVDLYAPGGEFIDGETRDEDLIVAACSRFTTIPELAPCRENPEYVLGDGTSFAAPLAAAIAALVEGRQKGETGGIVLRACLLAGADRFSPFPGTLSKSANALGALGCQPVGLGLPRRGPEPTAEE